MNRAVPRFAVLMAFLSGSLSLAVPVLLPGTVIQSSDADYAALVSVLGIPDPITGTTLLAVDLGSLSFDPNVAVLIDDGLPPSGAPSGLGASGIDMDAAGGLSGDGSLVYASTLFGFLAGQRIDAPGDAVIQAIEPLLNAPGYTNRTLAAPGGTGGPGFLLGTPDDVLGAPDAIPPAVLTSGGIVLLPEFGFYSIGSFGIVGLGFDSPLDRNANIGGTPFDFVVYDVGGTPENGFVVFDRTPEPGSLSLFLGLGLSAIIAVKRLSA
jgi:hypothetical protein